MNIFTTIKSPPPEAMLPQKPFLIETSFFELDPKLPENAIPIKNRLDSMECDFETWTKEQDKRFALAMRRIKLCAFLRGTKSAFDPRGVKGHYVWCPASHWMDDYFKELDPRV